MITVVLFTIASIVVALPHMLHFWLRLLIVALIAFSFPFGLAFRRLLPSVADRTSSRDLNPTSKHLQMTTPLDTRSSP